MSEGSDSPAVGTPISKRRLSDLRVVDLKAELEKRDLDRSGVKAILVERLQQALEAEGISAHDYLFDTVTPSKVTKTDDDADRMDHDSQNGLSTPRSAAENVENDSTYSTPVSEAVATTTTATQEMESPNQTTPVAGVTPKLDVKDFAEPLTPAPEKQITVQDSMRIKDAAAAADSRDGGSIRTDNMSMVVNVDDEEIKDLDRSGLVQPPPTTATAAVAQSAAFDAVGVTGSPVKTKSEVDVAAAAAVETSQTAAAQSEVTTTPTKRSLLAGADGSIEGKQLRNKPPASPSNRNIWVSNLSMVTKAADLKLICSKYGRVIGAKIVTSPKAGTGRCYGYVTMSNADEASKCIQHLHRTELHGKQIYVDRAQDGLVRLQLDKLRNATATLTRTQCKPSRYDDKKLAEAASRTKALAAAAAASSTTASTTATVSVDGSGSVPTAVATADQATASTEQSKTDADTAAVVQQSNELRSTRTGSDHHRRHGHDSSYRYRRGYHDYGGRDRRGYHRSHYDIRRRDGADKSKPAAAAPTQTTDGQLSASQPENSATKGEVADVAVAAEGSAAPSAEAADRTSAAVANGNDESKPAQEAPPSKTGRTSGPGRPQRDAGLVEMMKLRRERFRLRQDARYHDIQNEKRATALRRERARLRQIETNQRAAALKLERDKAVLRMERERLAREKLELETLRRDLRTERDRMERDKEEMRRVKLMQQAAAAEQAHQRRNIREIRDHHHHTSDRTSGSAMKRSFAGPDSRTTGPPESKRATYESRQSSSFDYHRRGGVDRYDRRGGSGSAGSGADKQSGSAGGGHAVINSAAAAGDRYSDRPPRDDSRRRASDREDRAAAEWSRSALGGERSRLSGRDGGTSGGWGSASGLAQTSLGTGMIGIHPFVAPSPASIMMSMGGLRPQPSSSEGRFDAYKSIGGGGGGGSTSSSTRRY